MPWGIRIIVALSLLLLLQSSNCPFRHHRPNIILIYADDMGYGDLNIQNDSSKIPTPNLDTLALSGMRFTNAHSTSSVCSPSRYSILTGRYHWRGVLKRGIVHPWGDPAIEENQKTIAHLLSNIGYTTACIGKWHLGMKWPFKEGLGPNDSLDVWHSTYENEGRYWKYDAFDWDKPISAGPITAGFDYYFGDGTINFPPYAWIENDRVITKPTRDLVVPGNLPLEGGWGLRPGPSSDTYDLLTAPIRLTEKAVNWIESQSGKDPFFLYFSLPSPHAPIIPTETFHGKSMAGPYGDYVVQTDWMVGQIRQTLRKLKLEKKTLVIFTSDNGPEHYAYDRVLNYHHHSAGPWRGVKRDLLDGGHRVPFLVSYPRIIPEGVVVDEAISQVDLMATLLELAGAPKEVNAGEDSRSLLNLWRGKGDPYESRPIVHHTLNGTFAIRKDDWVLIMGNKPTVSPIPKGYQDLEKVENVHTQVILYNLKEDHKQLVNLAEQRPEVVEELKNLLLSIQGKKEDLEAPAL